MNSERNKATIQNNNFIFLDTSDQGINENNELKNQKFRTKLLKTFYSRDSIRNKNVGCRIYTNETDYKNESEEKKNCRICIQDEEYSQSISPCKCKGSSEFVHQECLKMWILEQFGVNKIYNKNLFCEICKHKFDYKVKFVDRFDISQFKKIKLLTKICWIIQLVFIALCIYTSMLVIQKFGIDSITTIAIIIVVLLVLIVIIIYLCFSISSAHKVEMIEEWQFINYKEQNNSKRQIPNKFIRINQVYCL